MVLLLSILRLKLIQPSADHKVFNTLTVPTVLSEDTALKRSVVTFKTNSGWTSGTKITTLNYHNNDQISKNI